MTTTDGPAPHLHQPKQKAPNPEQFTPSPTASSGGAIPMPKTNPPKMPAMSMPEAVRGVTLRYLTEPLDRACAVLNNLIRLDKRAVQTLMMCRAPIEQETAKQECFVTGGSDECPTMSGLGLLNTVLLATIGRRVALRIDDSALNPFEDGTPEFVPYTGDADAKITTSKAELLERLGVLQSKHNALEDKLTEMEEANKAWQEKSLHQEKHADRMKEENEALRKENIDLKKRVLSADSLGPTLPKTVPQPMTWAEGLIRQLPHAHEGRNSWLLNHGHGSDVDQMREEWRNRNPLSEVTPPGDKLVEEQRERELAQRELEVKARTEAMLLHDATLRDMTAQRDALLAEQQQAAASNSRLKSIVSGLEKRLHTAEIIMGKMDGEAQERRQQLDYANTTVDSLRRDNAELVRQRDDACAVKNNHAAELETLRTRFREAVEANTTYEKQILRVSDNLYGVVPRPDTVTHCADRCIEIINLYKEMKPELEAMRKKLAEAQVVPDTVSMSLSDFNKLPEYSCTLPTGTKAGKQWKRRKHDGTWCLGTYYELDDLDPASTTQIGISWQHILIADDANSVIDMISRLRESDVRSARAQAIYKENTGEETELPVDVLVYNLFSTIKRDGKRTFPAVAAEARRLEETTTEENAVTYCRACRAKLPNGQPGSERYTCACGASGLRFMSEKPTTVLLPVKKLACPKCHALLVLRQGVEVVPDTVRCGICEIEWRANELEEITVSTPHPVGQDEVPKQNQTLPPKQRTE